MDVSWFKIHACQCQCIWIHVHAPRFSFDIFLVVLPQELQSFTFEEKDYEELPFDFYGGYIGYLGYVIISAFLKVLNLVLFPNLY